MDFKQEKIEFNYNDIISSYGTSVIYKNNEKKDYEESDDDIQQNLFENADNNININLKKTKKI